MGYENQTLYYKYDKNIIKILINYYFAGILLKFTLNI